MSNGTVLFTAEYFSIDASVIDFEISEFPADSRLSGQISFTETLANVQMDNGPALCNHRTEMYNLCSIKHGNQSIRLPEKVRMWSVTGVFLT